LCKVDKLRLKLSKLWENPFKVESHGFFTAKTFNYSENYGSDIAGEMA